jgi:hypothetical protein
MKHGSVQGTWLGKDFRVTQSRGKLIPSTLAPHVMATVHPSQALANSPFSFALSAAAPCRYDALT